MRDLASPVQAFVRDQCDVGVDKEVAIDEIYGAYRQWCEENGHTKLAKHTFGRDLRAAIPSIEVKRPRGAENRLRVYTGISLRSQRSDEPALH
jgi:putative DNA primase/helicase